MTEIIDVGNDALSNDLKSLARASMRGGITFDGAMKKLVDVLNQTEAGNKQTPQQKSIDAAYDEVKKLLPEFTKRVSNAAIAHFAKDKFPNGTH